MEKIGIITFQRAHNYGAVCQAYALKTYLENLRPCNVSMVDYWPEYRNGIYDLFNVDFERRSFLSNMKSVFTTICLFHKKHRRYQNFNNFLIEELNLEIKKKPFTDGKQIPDSKYDFLFFGSDQIWRYNEFLSFRGLDSVYWGEYPLNSKTKKIAYAASIGKLISSKLNQNTVQKYLANFEEISVREKPLLDYIKSITEQKIYHVLDPVFLLEKKEWELLAQKRGFKKQFKKKYLLLYDLNFSPDSIAIASKIAKEKGLEIFRLTREVKRFEFSNKVMDTIGPMGFLNAILNSDFVVASSFHGVAFSILLNKNFISTGLKNNSDRVTSLLKLLDIENHYVVDSDSHLPTSIDFEKVNNRLNKLKDYSKEFISNSLKNKSSI